MILRSVTFERAKKLGFLLYIYDLYYNLNPYMTQDR